MAFGINLGKWFKDRTDEVRDIFDANTAGDYARRAQQQQQQGQPVVRQTYAQQQIARGNTRPYNNIGQQVFGNTARYLNTLSALPSEAYGTTRALSAMATGNQQALTNANRWNLVKDEVVYNPTGGLLRAGTMFDSAQQKRTASNLDALKRGAATGIGTFGEVFPVGKGVQFTTTAGKISKPAVFKIAGQGAAASAGADVGQQYISTGKIDPKQVAISAVTGAGLSLAPTGVKIGVQKATPDVVKTAIKPKPIPDNLLAQRNELLRGRQNAILAKKPIIVKNFDKRIDELDYQIDEATKSPLKAAFANKEQGGYVRLPFGEQVDEKLFHGSPVANIQEFDLNAKKNGPQLNALGKGVYLTSSEDAARRYASKSGTIYNVKNPKKAQLVDLSVRGEWTDYKTIQKIANNLKELGVPSELGEGWVETPYGMIDSYNSETIRTVLQNARKDGNGLVEEALDKSGINGLIAGPTKLIFNPKNAEIPPQVGKTATIERPVQTKTKLAEPPMPPAKVGVQTMSPPPPPRGTGVKILPPGKTKKTRFASKTVPESEFVSEPVKGSIKAPDYSPQTEKQGYANALGRLKQQGDEAFENEVFTNLNKKPGTISRQEAIDATTTAQLLDSKGDEASIRKATDIYEKLSEHYTAAGQTIQVAAILSKRTPEGMRGWATSTLKKASVEPTPQLQRQIVELSQQKKMTELAELVSKNIPSSTGDKIINIWRAGLLTAPTTTFGNVVGNTLEATVRKGFVNPVATVADTVMGQFTGKRTMSLAKPGEYAKGVGQGAKEFGKGVDNTKYDIQKRTNYNNKVADAYVNGVYKLMGVADKPYSTATMRESLSSMAKAEAINKGLKGDQRDKFIKEFIDNPPEQARLRAEQEGDYSVFKNPTTLGKAASGLKRPLGPVGDFVVPFTQVPAAIATRIVERTPIGIANQIVKQLKHIKSGGEFDQRAMSQAIGNGAFGPAVIGAGFALANADMLTYGYPTDKKERALWEEEGKQPYSVKIGDRWYSMNYLQPFGALLAIGGQASEAAKKGENISEIVGQGVATAGQSIMNQSFLKGIGGALDAVSDPERSARKYIEQTTSSLTPNFVRSFARASDDIQRAPEGIVEGVKSGIPGLREQTTPKYSAITGDPLPAKDNFANQYLNPLKPSKVRSSDLTSELRRLQDAEFGAIPTESNKNVFGNESPLDQKQLNDLNSKMAKNVSEEWKKVVANPKYASLSDEDKKKTLQKASSAVVEATKRKYSAENNLGEYSPNFDGKQTKLSTNAKRYAQGGQVDYFSDTIQTPKEKYESALETYNLDKGTYSAVTNKKKTEELKKLKVASDYDNDTVDLHGMSKQDVWDLVSTDQNGQALVDKLLKYDQALTDAGVQTKNKFTDKYGNISIQPKSSGGSGGRKGKSISYQTISPVKKVTMGGAKKYSAPGVKISRPKRRVAKRTIRIKA